MRANRLGHTRIDRTRLGVLGASVAGNCVNGLVAGTLLSIVLVPLSKDFGWSRASITGVGAVVAPVNIFLPILVGWLGDRIGARRILMLGNLGFALSLAAASMVPPNLWVFYLTFIAIAILGHVTGPLLFGKIIAGWFDAKRGTAMGLVAGLGNGLSTIVFPIVAAVLLTKFGWRGAYLGTSIIVALIGFPPMFLFLRDPPKGKAVQRQAAAGEADVSVKDALRTRSYWMLALAMALGSGCMMSVLSHTVPALTDRGFSLAQAVPVVTCISLTGMLAQMGVGTLMDRVRSPWLAAPLYGMSVIGIQLIMHGTALPVVLLGGALLGVGVGTEFAILPLLLSSYYGVTHYGKIAGATYSGILLVGGVLPFLLDWSFDVTGSYISGFTGMQVALIAGVVLISCLPPICRRPVVKTASAFEPTVMSGQTG